MIIKRIAEYLREEEAARMRAWVSLLSVDNPVFTEEQRAAINNGDWPGD